MCAVPLPGSTAVSLGQPLPAVRCFIVQIRTDRHDTERVDGSVAHLEQVRHTHGLLWICFKYCSNLHTVWILRARDRDRDILTRLRLGHQRPLNRRCPDQKYPYVNNNRLTEYPGTPAWTPATSKSRVSNCPVPRLAGVQAGVPGYCYCLHTGIFRLDTCDLVVAGVPISISSKYLYLYLALKVLTHTVYGRFVRYSGNRNHRGKVSHSYFVVWRT